MDKRTKCTPKDTLTDLLLEFIEAAVHEFLTPNHRMLTALLCLSYCRRTESFEQRVLYDVPVHMNRYPVLCEYIRSMLAGCRAWIHSGEIEKLCIVILSKEGRTMDTLVIETKWMTTLRGDATAPSSPSCDSSYALPLVQLEEAFRATLVALIATPISIKTTASSSSGLKPNSFRILAHTKEDVSTPMTSAADASRVANSWVLADPFWYKEDESKQEGEKELVPVKSVRTSELPFRLQVYLETR